MQYNSRNEVPEKYKWDLSDFFKNEKEFDECFSETEKLINKLPEYRDKVKDAKKLYEFLEIETKAIVNWENLYVYSYLLNDQELGISLSIQRKEKCEKLNVLLCNNISFFNPELLKLTSDEYEDLFKQEEKLSLYRKDLDKIFRNKEHILDEDKDVIVNNLVQAMNHFDDLYSNLKNSEIDYGKVRILGEDVSIAVTNYRKLMKNKDENIRKEVYEKFNSSLIKHEQTFSMLLNSYVSMQDKLSMIYNHKNSWEAKLFKYNLSDKVYKTLVDTVFNNLTPINRYYELKKNILNKDVLYPYDLSLELVSNDKKYSIEEAQELCLKSIEPLGSEYIEKFKKVFDNHYIDYCQYKGKQSGGYSFSTATTDSRILMSFNDDLDSISTIIHEGGHNVNHQYMKENNPVIYRENESIVAEVASLTNECLLSNYLANNGKTKEEKLSGIANIMGVIVSNLYGAVREGKLEQDFYELVHDGGMITKDYLNDKTKEMLLQFYGGNVKDDCYTGNSWITRSHYYMNFYLYSYAISISVATSLANKIINGDKNALDKYLEFLKCGSDKWPKEAFKVLGVDLEDKSVYEDACLYLNNLIDKYYEICEE